MGTEPSKDSLSPLATPLENTPSSTSTANFRGMIGYRLPMFPDDIQEELRAGSTDLINNRKQRCRIVLALFEDLKSKAGWLVDCLILFCNFEE